MTVFVSMLMILLVCLQVHQAQGKFDEAVELYKKDLAISIKALGEEHPSVAMTYDNLAQVCVLRTCSLVVFDK